MEDGCLIGESSSSISRDEGELERSKTSDVMDANLWARHLPEEVMHTILAWLPLRSYCRLRTVCKNWNQSAYNPAFLKICERVPPQAPFWIVFSCGGPLVFNTKRRTWHVASSFLSYDYFTRDAVLDAAGSLLFYRSLNPNERLLFVFNPLSKHITTLPAILRSEHFRAMGIVQDSESNSYKIYAVVENSRSLNRPRESEVLRLHLFDSAQGRWEMSVNLFRDPEDADNEKHNVLGCACCNGRLYFLTERLQDEYEDDLYEPVRKRYKVFEVGTRAWEEVSAHLPLDLSFPCLFASRGRLLLGGGVAVWIGLVSIHVWQLIDDPLEWIEILRMPDDLVRDVAGRGHPMVVIANGDFVGVSSGTQGKIVRYMCDLNKGCWWALPSEYDHVPLNYLEGLTTSGTLLFEPKLNATF